jgi:hypothetical protein
VRRRRIIIVLAACVLVGIGIVAFWLAEREPEYKGKKLSTWLKIYYKDGSGEVGAAQRDAAEAVRHIGTNAIPSLLNWLRYRDPLWKKQLRKMIGPTSQRTQIATALDLPRDHGLDISTLNAFKILGPQAAPAVPELIRFVQDTNHPAISLRAAECLIYVYGDKQTLAVSSPLLNNPDPVVRRVTTNVFLWLAPKIFETNAKAEVSH